MPKIIDNSEVGVRSNHNLSFNWLGSADFGRIVPFHVQELLGTDKVVRCKPHIEVQMLPLASPTFGKLDLYVHYYFVPTRLLWKSFLDVYSQTGENKDATPPYWKMSDFADIYYASSPDPEDPESDIDASGKRMLFKHWTSFGLPPFWMNNQQGGQNIPVEILNQRISVLPFRAYAQIWWDFYRDTELIPDSNKSIYLTDSDGCDVDDYIEDLTQYPLRYIPRARSIKESWIAELFVRSGLEGVDPSHIFTPKNLNPDFFSNNTTTIQSIGRSFPSFGNVRANSSSVGEGNDTIGELNSVEMRRVEALTRLSERLSLSGKRQIDMLFSQYGIKPEFSKLNMAQYIGGAKSTVLVSDITATSTTANFEELHEIGSVLGQKAGAGYCAFNDLSIEYTAAEPGYLLGVFSVMPHVHFVQGLGKEWFRNDVNDWFRRELEHVGQVAVPKHEVGIAYGGAAAGPAFIHDNDLDTFAFTQPYYEYKRKMDILAGDFMYYHKFQYAEGEQISQDVAYMQSMGMYIDYPVDREYNAENMLIKGKEVNKIFTYLGGNIWEDADDHFFLDCDVDCLINRPMDGYAVPTIETTEDPHLKSAPIGKSKQI